MQTGVVNLENLSQVLKNVAHRRQTGCLEIRPSEGIINIVFVSGKIVDCYNETEGTAARVARRLERTAKEGTSDLLRMIYRHEVLDFLFNLDLINDCVYTFKNFTPEYDRDYAPGISVSQYLLDKASYESEIKKFNQIFPADSVILKLDLAGIELSEEERFFYDWLPERSDLSKLRSESFLNTYHTIVFLISFYERAVIEIVTDDVYSEPLAPADSAIVNILEDTTQRPFIEKELMPEEVQDKAQVTAEKTEIHIFHKQEKNLTKSKKKNNTSGQNAVRKNSVYHWQNVPVIFCLMYILFAAVAVSYFWQHNLSGF